ncbi:MAG: DUF1731 domain-containing protein [Fimbriimonas sp.]
MPNREFNAILLSVVGAPPSPPMPEFLLELGALMLGTETELILKSRRGVPRRLLEAGFTFQYPEWREAARDLWSRRG